MSNFYIDGMTLRDWFAGQIMVGLIPDILEQFELIEERNDRIELVEIKSITAYRISDIMLKTREREDV